MPVLTIGGGGNETQGLDIPAGHLLFIQGPACGVTFQVDEKSSSEVVYPAGVLFSTPVPVPDVGLYRLLIRNTGGAAATWVYWTSPPLPRWATLLDILRGLAASLRG